MTIAVDGSARFHSASASTGSVSLTTTKPNDIIILFVLANGGPTKVPPSSVNLPPSAWTKRGAGGNGASIVIEEWFAIAPNPLTNEVITVTSTTKNVLDLAAKAFSGCNTVNPFDGACVHSGKNTPLSLTTIKPNTLVIVASSGGYAPFTPGFTLDAGPNLQEQWELFSSPQTNLTVSCAPVYNGMVGDALVAAPPGPGGTVWVDPVNGLDANDGLQPTPFKTLPHAQSIVSGKPGANIRLVAGTHRLSAPLSLAAGDSGSTWQADVPNADAIVSGAKPLNGWTLVTDAPTLARLHPAARGQVMSTTLAANGIAIGDVGVMSIRGFAAPATSHGELSFNGAIQELARWPDKSAGYAETAAPINNAAPYSFGFTQPQPKQAWAAETDIWAYGYWAYDWADAYLPVSSFNDATNVATLGSMGPQNFGVFAGNRMYFLNILAELSTPGEWYLDRAAGVVYFWPSSAITQDSVEISTAIGLISTSGTSNLKMQGVILEACRGNAVNIPDGDGNSLVGCVIRNIGNSAGSINSTNSSALGCDIHDCGDAGFSMMAGNRATLVSGGQVVDACHIWNFGRWSRTYVPGVHAEGVGWKITRCLIEHAPHQGIHFGGNDGLVQFNEIQDVVTGSSDAGGVYGGRNASARGTQIIDNYIHDIVGYSTGAKPSAVYHDDMGSGLIVERNIFERCKRGGLIGGGDDNIVTGNIFKNMLGDCCVDIDSRGLTWAANLIPGIAADLHTLPYTTAPWSTEYPTLPNFDNDQFGMPKRNVVTGNLYYGTGVFLRDTMDPSAEQYNTLTPNTIVATTTFAYGLPAGDPNRALLPA